MDKLNATVSFPIDGLNLASFAAPECIQPPGDCIYDLYAVSNHGGTLSGGHYTAMCRVGEDAWYSFNDEAVTPVAAWNVVSPAAYILFYARRKYKVVAGGGAKQDSGVPVVAAPSHSHKRSGSSEKFGLKFLQRREASVAS
jgi:hypothetical protein